MEKDTIFELDNPHLKCKIDSFKRQNNLKEVQDTDSLESKFYIETETIFDLNNCSPILKDNEPIDKTKQFFAKKMQIAMVEDRKEVSEDNAQLNVEIRKQILNAKIAGYETQLSTLQDSNKINQLNNRKQIASTKLENISQLNKQKLFDM